MDPPLVPYTGTSNERLLVVFALVLLCVVGMFVLEFESMLKLKCRTFGPTVKKKKKKKAIFKLVWAVCRCCLCAGLLVW